MTAALKSGKRGLRDAAGAVGASEKMSAAAARRRRCCCSRAAALRRARAGRQAIGKRHAGDVYHAPPAWMHPRIPTGTGWFCDRSSPAAARGRTWACRCSTWRGPAQPAPAADRLRSPPFQGRRPVGGHATSRTRFRTGPFEGGKSLEPSASWRSTSPPAAGTACRSMATRAP
jgi:hypothetical protein